VDRWLQELEVPDPEHTSPFPWLEKLARWLIHRETAGALSRLIRRRPQLPPALAELHSQCQSQGLKPVFELYQALDDRGIDLKVLW
jgi:hypothetical protein